MNRLLMLCVGALTALAAFPATAAAQDETATARHVYGTEGSDSPHGPMRLDIDCSACHTATGWTPARADMQFDHSEQTDFLLVNRHAATGCASCHLNLQFAEPRLANADCGSCHVDVHQGKLSGACATCHSTISFVDTPDLQLHARTNFPLTGSHLQITCESCHTNDLGGAFTPMNSDCASCHLDSYLATSSSPIDHVAAGFPTDCQQCHNTLTWTGGALFDHLAASGFFALTGVHSQLRCASCHIPPGSQLLFTPSAQDDCVACHQSDYQREHAGDGFPTTCIDCHDDNDWGSANFSHFQASAGFALIGAHAGASCSACHTQPGNQLIFVPQGQNDCIACHQIDYQQEHAGSGFPTTCLDCHTQNNWDATFLDHDAQFFPIYSGKHQGQWGGSCQTCHTVPGNQQVFSCLDGCHEHDRTSMDDKHKNEPGYVYESNTCLSCHPNGSKD